MNEKKSFKMGVKFAASFYKYKGMNFSRPWRSGDRSGGGDHRGWGHDN